MIHENNLPGGYLLRIGLLYLFSILINVSTAQHANDSYSLAKEIYGTSDKLMNGVLYYPLHPKATGYPCYPYPGYHPGNIFIDGDKFENEQIKYNIEMQRLVLKKEISNGALPEVLLFNHRIDSFSIDKRMFVNSRHIADSTKEDGFYEIIHRGDNLYLAFHKIFFNNDYDRKHPFGKYHTPINRYYRLEGNHLRRFSNKRQFAELFDSRQNEIRKFIRQNKIRFRKINSEELRNLIIYSEELN